MFKAKKLERLVFITLAIALLVIVLGAYTRLKDAGLGCPDWPGCYGQLLAPTHDQKAWIEMIHRYIAGTLGILILIITISSIKLHKELPQTWILCCAISALVVFQALLGMWTVTMRLYPIVVMGHLLGGAAIWGLLVWLYLRLKISPATHFKANKLLKVSAILALLLLIVQIALGGWTSANYAGVVCADFPTCQGQWWPAMDWREAFDLTSVGIFTSPGIPLENTARVTIQMAHRLGALLLSILLYFVCYQLLHKQNKSLRIVAGAIFILISTQIILGICNVLYGLPLAVSLLHNLVAELLLAAVIYLVFMVHLSGKNSHAK